MKKVLFLTLFVMSMTLNINNVKAVACDDEDMARLRGLAAGVSYNAKYIGNTEGGMTYQDYKVNFMGLTDELYVSDSHYTFKVYKDVETIILQSGSVDLQIYSNKCNDWRLTTITIDLPKFNEYSVYEVCQIEKNKELDVCDPWFNGNVSKEELNEMFSNDVQVGETELSEDIMDWFFLNKYKLLIATSVLVICVIAFIYLKNKKDILD